jgi:TPR repeat protein
MARLGCRYLEGRGIKKDEKEALHWLKAAAEGGSSLGKAELGYAYEFGLGVPLDYPEAMKWYRRAAEQTNAFAMMRVGCLFLDGHGLPRDPLLAKRWFLLAADLGNPRAMCILGNLLEKELPGTNSPSAEAVSYYKKSAALGDKYGCYALAQCYHKGYGVSIDAANAFLWAFRSATQNVASAQHFLGESYRLGVGTVRDYNEAMRWYTNAATNGDPNGWYSLAMMYNYRDVGLTNLQTCLALLLKAAESGHLQAQSLYSGNCLRGVGVPQNIPEAIRWLRKSAEGGWPEAELVLGGYYVTGTNGLPQDEKEGLKWQQRAAAHGNPQAQFIIGMRLLQGNGLGKDPAQAIRMLREAAEHGDSLAQGSLGYAIEIGEAGKIDLVEACMWDQLSANQGVPAAKVNLQKLLPRLNEAQQSEALRRAQAFTPKPVDQVNPVRSDEGPVVRLPNEPNPENPSQTIRLKNGRVIVGTIKMRIGSKIYIRTADDKEQEIDTCEVISGGAGQ